MALCFPVVPGRGATSRVSPQVTLAKRLVQCRGDPSARAWRGAVAKLTPLELLQGRVGISDLALWGMGADDGLMVSDGLFMFIYIYDIWFISLASLFERFMKDEWLVVSGL